MDAGERKNKMIQVSKVVYKMLLEEKHELESNTETSCSFNDVVKHLLESKR